MDPLSITASSIAVLSAVTASGKGINRLISLRNAPTELCALKNQVESLRLTQVAVQLALFKLRGTETYRLFEESFAHSLKAVESANSELHSEIEYHLSRHDDSDQSGRAKVSRSAWLGAKPEIERLEQRISSARRDLDTVLGAMQLHLTASTRESVLQIQSISVMPLDTTQAQHRTEYRLARSSELQEELYSVLDNLSRRHQLPRIHCVDKDQQAAETDQETVTETGLTTHAVSGETQQGHQKSADRTLDDESVHTKGKTNCVVAIDATMSVQRCPKFCKCRCHVSTHLQFPPWARKTLGQLMFAYTNALFSRSCDYKHCKKAEGKAHFSFMFPPWLAARAVNMTYAAGSLTGSGARCSIKIPVVLPSTHRIWFAIRDGNMALFQQLLSNPDFTPYIVDEDGWNMLHYAVDFEMAGMHEMLLQQKFVGDFENNERQTPAEEALYCFRSSLFNYDVEEIVESLYFTSLHLAVVLPLRFGPLSEQTLDIHFRHVNQPDKLGMMPLHWASRMGDSAAVELLLTWGADVRLQDKQCKTALHHAGHACLAGDAVSVKSLLDAGCSPDVPDMYGQSALFYSVDRGRSLVSLLIDHGANANHADFQGNTALYSASRWGNPEVINELLIHGANINHRNMYGYSPMQGAVIFDEARSIKALAACSKFINANITYMLCPRAQILDKLITNGILLTSA